MLKSVTLPHLCFYNMGGLSLDQTPNLVELTEKGENMIIQCHSSSYIMQCPHAIIHPYYVILKPKGCETKLLYALTGH